MNSEDSNRRIKRSVLVWVCRRLTLWMALLVVLMSVAGCQPGANATVETTQDAGIERGPVDTPGHNRTITSIHHPSCRPQRRPTSARDDTAEPIPQI